MSGSAATAAILATSASLLRHTETCEKAIGTGEFREDLFYRLNVFPIELPPSESGSTIYLCSSPGWSRKARDSGVSLTTCALGALRCHSWPGNVRELENLLERLSVLYPASTISRQQLPRPYCGDGPLKLPAASAAPSSLCAALEAPERSGWVDLKSHLAAVEFEYIQRALQESNGVVAEAARRLRLRRTTLVEKLRRNPLNGP